MTTITTFYMKTLCKHCLGLLIGAFKTLFPLQNLDSTTYYLLTVSLFQSKYRFPLCPVSNFEKGVFEEANESVCLKKYGRSFLWVIIKMLTSRASEDWF